MWKASVKVEDGDVSVSWRLREECLRRIEDEEARVGMMMRRKRRESGGVGFGIWRNEERESE